MCRNARVWKVQARTTLIIYEHDTDTKQLESIVELHSALGNVDAIRDVQTRQTLSHSTDHCLSLTRIQQQSVFHA